MRDCVYNDVYVDFLGNGFFFSKAKKRIQVIKIRRK